MLIRWPGAALIVITLALPACGSTDRAGKTAVTDNSPVMVAPSLAPATAVDTPDTGRLQALRRIVQDQSRAFEAYKLVRDQQQELYYIDLSVIEEGLRLGTPADKRTLLEHWQSASRASQQIDQALNQLQSSFTAFHPAIIEAESLRAPFATILRGQQDTAQDELRRQKGLMEFENQKMAVLRQTIMQDQVPPPPIQSPISADLKTPTPEKPIAKVEEADEPQTLPQETITQATHSATPPLAIIRFNRPNIVFRAQLNDAVRQSKLLEPAGRIHIVGVAPLRKTGQEQLLSQAESHQFAQSIIRAAQALGVPPENIRMTAQTSETAASSEVHIYADK